MRRCWAALITLLISLPCFTACSATGMVDCQGQLTYNPDMFTPAEKTWIHESAERWNTFASHNVINVRPGYDDVCTIIIEDVPKTYSGTHSPNDGIIRIDRERLKQIAYNKRRFESVVMHEMGHSLGFDHIGVKQADALMSWASADDFTEIDWFECLNKNICKPPFKPKE